MIASNTFIRHIRYTSTDYFSTVEIVTAYLDRLQFRPKQKIAEFDLKTPVSEALQPSGNICVSMI